MRAFAARIRAQGVLVSAFAPGTPLQRYHFPLRNRLLGALCAGALVVEAVAGSGAAEHCAAAQAPRQAGVRHPRIHSRSGGALLHS